jgi:flagellar basal body-associated protein FliL
MIQRSSKNKPLLFIILILLVANLAGIAYNYFMMKKDGPKHSPMDRKEIMGRYLKDDLKFTDEQMARYKTLSASNKTETEPLIEALKQEREKRLNFLREHNYADSALDQAVNRSMHRQAALDRKMLEFIRNVRALCNDRQKQAFDTGFYKMMRHSRGDKKPLKK